MKQATYTVLAALLVLVLSSQVLVPDTLVTDSVSGSKTLIYTFAIKDNIAAPTWRITQEAIEEAIALEADVVILHLNTYGGEVSAADSIRTKLLNAPMPVHVFIDDNAASAGALIAIACDSIYMKPGGKIGAATVVNQTGEQVPDKYQSYHRIKVPNLATRCQAAQITALRIRDQRQQQITVVEFQVRSLHIEHRDFAIRIDPCLGS